MPRRGRALGAGLWASILYAPPGAPAGSPLVTLLPVVEREMRVASRRRWTYWGRTAAGVASVLAMAWWVLLRRSLGLGSLGGELFAMTSFLAGCVALLSGPLLTADVVSSERREGTLGLLFLTDLRGWEVSLGKLAASSLGAFFYLVSMLPVLAVSMLMGGVSAGEYLRMVAWLLSTMACSLSLGLLASTMSVNAKRAGAWALGLIVMACGLVPALGGLAYLLGAWLFDVPNNVLDGWYEATSAWVSLVPAYFHAFDSAYSNAAVYYTRGMGVSWCLTAASLTWASWRMSRLAKDEGTRGGGARWWARTKAPRGCRSDADAARRHRLLELGPMCWLLGRHRWRTAWVWGLLALAALVNGLVIYLNGPLASTPLEAFWVGTSLVLHFLLKLWMAAEAPSQFHEDRRSGAMELLLTTPLTAQEIVSGRLAALWRRWRVPLGAVLAADVLQLALGVAKEQANSADEWIWFWVARMTFLVADAWAFAWMGMWLGASTTGHRTTAPLLGLVLGIPWLGFLLYLLIVATIGNALFQALGEVGNILFALVGGTLNSALWAAWGRRRLHETFREWAILRPGERRQKGT